MSNLKLPVGPQELLIHPDFLLQRPLFCCRNSQHRNVPLVNGYFTHSTKQPTGWFWRSRPQDDTPKVPKICWAIALRIEDGNVKAITIPQCKHKIDGDDEHQPILSTFTCLQVVVSKIWAFFYPLLGIRMFKMSWNHQLGFFLWIFYVRFFEITKAFSKKPFKNIS